MTSKDFPYCEFCTFPIGEMQTSSDPDFVQKEIKAEKKRRVRDKKVDAGPFVSIRRGTVIFFCGLAFLSFAIVFLVLNFHDFSNLVERHQIDEENKYPKVAILGLKNWQDWRQIKIGYKQQCNNIEKEIKEKWCTGGFEYDDNSLSAVLKQIKVLKKEFSNNNIEGSNFASQDLMQKFDRFKSTCKPSAQALFVQQIQDIEKEIKEKWNSGGYEFDKSKYNDVLDQIKKMRKEISDKNLDVCKLTSRDLVYKYDSFKSSCKPKVELYEQQCNEVEKEIREKWCSGGYKYDSEKFAAVQGQISKLKKEISNKNNAEGLKAASQELEDKYNLFKFSCVWQPGLPAANGSGLVSGKKQGTWVKPSQKTFLSQTQQNAYRKECDSIIFEINHVINYPYQYAYEYSSDLAKKIIRDATNIKEILSVESAAVVNDEMSKLKSSRQSFNLTKKWKSGVKNKTFEHVISSNTPEKWIPESDKWEFIYPDTANLTVSPALSKEDRAYYRNQAEEYANYVSSIQSSVAYEYDRKLASTVLQKAGILKNKSATASGKELYQYLVDLKNSCSDFQQTIKNKVCNKCNGTGKIVKEYQNCKTCKGRGKVKEGLGSLINIASEVTKAASGVDIGKVNTKDVPCPTCNGKRRVPKTFQTCDSCNGTGKYTKK